MKTIALCVNLPALDNGGFKQPEICKQFPGSGWAPYLHKYAEAMGIRVISGSQAKNLVLAGDLDPKHVQVIQEELNENGQWLIEEGAEASLLFCFESPIFASQFYDELPKIKDRFKRQMLFGHWQGTDQVYFPSFDLNDLREPEPWEGRKPLVAVLSNKHYSMLPRPDSPSFDYAIKHQLHDLRYQALEYFHNRGLVDVYGKGWPAHFAKPVDDKIEVMRGYKFALCFENGSYPGYVTEKVIDCLVAGVIPIYAGAPDIDDFLPRFTFLRYQGDWLRDFSDRWEGFARLFKYDHGRFQYEGARFLRSPEGRRFSFQGFAENVLRILGHSAQD